MYQRDILLKDLRENVIEIHFTKVNGENRIMHCTLLPKYLPSSYNEDIKEQNSEKTFHKQNYETIAAWDIRQNGWRSFRIDSVSYVQTLSSDY